MALSCLTCQWKLGQSNSMELTSDGAAFYCPTCKTVRASSFAPPVITVEARRAISPFLFLGGFLLLVLSSLVYIVFPQLQIELTWTMLYSLYLIYFGLAFVNFRSKIYA